MWSVVIKRKELGAIVWVQALQKQFVAFCFGHAVEENEGDTSHNSAIYGL